MENLKYRFCT